MATKKKTAKKAVKKSAAKKKAAPAKKAKAKSAAPKKVLAVPVDVPQLTPYFAVSDAKAAIEFYKQVFGARQRSLMLSPDGKVAHVSLQIGNSVLMLSDMNPQNTSGRSSGVMLYVKDTDAVFNKAVSLGAKTLVPVSNMFWGDRWGMFEDPYGNLWQIATHLEDVKPAELAKRTQEAMGQPPPGGAQAGTPPPPPADAMADALTTSEHIAQA